MVCISEQIASIYHQTFFNNAESQTGVYEINQYVIECSNEDTGDRHDINIYFRDYYYLLI